MDDKLNQNEIFFSVWKKNHSLKGMENSAKKIFSQKRNCHYGKHFACFFYLNGYSKVLFLCFLFRNIILNSLFSSCKSRIIVYPSAIYWLVYERRSGNKGAKLQFQIHIRTKHLQLKQKPSSVLLSIYKASYFL